MKRTILYCSFSLVAIGVLLALLLEASTFQPARAAGPWYVAPGGDNGNDCQTPAVPCATINGAVGKASPGDTIYVAIGTYTGTGDEVVLIDRSVTLSGGWDGTFTTQSGTSTIDGEGSHRGVQVNTGVTAFLERLVVQDGYDSPWFGAGISNSGNLTLNHCSISGDTAQCSAVDNEGVLTANNTTLSENVGRNPGCAAPAVLNRQAGIVILNNTIVSANEPDGAIFNQGTLTLNSSNVTGNTAESGSVIGNWDGITTLNNSTIGGNTGSGIDNTGTVILNNSTISANADAFGAGIYNRSTVILNNSTISANEAASGAGIYNRSTVILNNSTISANTAVQGGGIYNSYGTVFLNNSTVSANTATDGGGIYNESGSVTLHNTILAGNMAVGTSPDCSGTISSSGYNLIGNTLACSFAPATGDLLNVSARLVSLGRNLGYYPLWPDSPAIDAGDPAGCTDHLGNPLMTDQRGSPRPLDGDGDGIAICDMGSYEFDPANFSCTAAFLPRITRNYCLDFFDDFSNPGSGWPVGDSAFVRAEYLGGEFRILTKQAGYFYLFRAPTCDRQNYVVEADTRWVGGTGNGYGLLFGIRGNFDHYYLFDVNTDYQMFRLYRRDPGGFATIVPPTGSAAINAGTARNHLRVTRDGSWITLEVNGVILGNWNDDRITGLTGVGIVSSAYSGSPVSDARFDNFKVTNVSGGAAMAPQVPHGAMKEEPALVAPDWYRDSVPPQMVW